jgi:hypothetical protein
MMRPCLGKISLRTSQNGGHICQKLSVDTFKLISPILVLFEHGINTQALRHRVLLNTLSGQYGKIPVISEKLKTLRVFSSSATILLQALGCIQ